MTDQNVADFFQTYNLKPSCHIVLSIQNSPDTFDAKKIVELQHEIKKFIFTHPQPLVIHSGLSVLLETHSPSKTRDYLMNLHATVKERDSQLIMLYDSPREKNLLENLEDIEPSTFMDDVVKIFDHSARCDILHLLANHKSLHYSDFLKQMDIEVSSNLAFHLKRLTVLKLIDKHDGRYTLTDRGKYFADVLFSLSMGKYSDPASKVIYCPLPQP